MSETEATQQTEFEFKAQVQRVLSLVINSLYTHSEIFLRELVSNASDALDKARFLQLTKKDEVTAQDGEPGITLAVDEEAKTLTIEDNGVGMTRAEVIENLGTIAQSGTSEFAARLSELSKKQKDEVSDVELIGQFGVGFYAAFMVASRVDVETLSMTQGAEPVLWRSSGEGSFTVVAGTREVPGTRITLHLKEEAAEFAQPWRVEGIVKKYSDFVMFPIHLDGRVINQSSALWRQPRSKVTEEQHKEFFKHLTGGRLGDEPLMTLHYQVEAPLQFVSLLYVPSKASPDLFVLQREQRPGLRLYARRVLIMETCEALVPSYLRFVRGVVDSEDLTLNVSRETLQEDRVVRQIEGQLTKQVLKELQRIADDDNERYGRFWKEFGQVFKEGLSVDWKNKDSIAKLCRFHTFRKGDELISLDDYVKSKPESQKAIYYLTGTDREQLMRSPHLEIFRKRDLDVLLLCDPIDEWVVKTLTEHDGLPLRSVAHGDLDLGDEGKAGDDDGQADEAKDGAEKAPEDIQPAIDAVKKVLGDRVQDVRASSRLTETASCLVAKSGDPGANFERLMRMIDDKTQVQRRILELNPGHPLVQNLAKLAARDPQSEQVELWAEMLHTQALLSEGVIEDPALLVKRIQDLLVESSNKAVGG